MKKSSRHQPVTARMWLALSKDTGVTSRMQADPYSMAYGSLLPHFSKRRTLTWDDAVVGLHIVYGWMPTIPKLGGIMQWEQQRKSDLTATLTRTVNGHVPTDDELAELMAFSNNSMVGASKLLHFLNPSTFPIWDSRVARAFFNRPKVYSYQVNKAGRWKLYQATLTNWLNDQQVKSRCAELKQLAGHLAGLTNLRLVELVLFHKTATRRKVKTA